MTDSLSERLLEKPTPPPVVGREPRDEDLTRELTVSKASAELTVKVSSLPNNSHQGTSLRYLEEEGLNPEEWEETHFRKLVWRGDSSIKFSYRRIANFATSERPPLDEILGPIKRQRPKARREDGDHGALVLLGDTQFGKIDGDGVEGTVQRTVDALDHAADSIESLRKRYDIGHIHVGWLGDHIEGFVSQGGANAWRTPLTLNEQIRLTRRVMTHSLVTFAPMADRVSLAAVPGNHGEPQRFTGTGVTRYDDSHDTESLIAVHDAVELARSTGSEAFEHVQFFTPETDELIVVNEVAGTVLAQHHGHKWRHGKHFDWWKGQAFHTPGMNRADVLASGHLHHLLLEHDGPRTFLQVPAMESDSTWFRHSTGTIGNPGLALAVVKDGQVKTLEMVK